MFLFGNGYNDIALHIKTRLGVETVTRFAFHLGFEAEIKMSTEFKIATSN